VREVVELFHLSSAEILSGDGLGDLAVLGIEPCGVEVAVFENSHLGIIPDGR